VPITPKRTRSLAPRIFVAETAELARYPETRLAEEFLRNRRRVKGLMLFM
jgi:hypothetical protein